MDMTAINPIAFVSCLLGIGVGFWLFRLARRESAALASERQTLLKRRVGLWGRRAHARALMAGGIAILYFSVAALITLLTRQ